MSQIVRSRSAACHERGGVCIVHADSEEYSHVHLVAAVQSVA